MNIVITVAPVNHFSGNEHQRGWHTVNSFGQVGAHRASRDENGPSNVCPDYVWFWLKVRIG